MYILGNKPQCSVAGLLAMEKWGTVCSMIHQDGLLPSVETPFVARVSLCSCWSKVGPTGLGKKRKVLRSQMLSKPHPGVQFLVWLFYDLSCWKKTATKNFKAIMVVLAQNIYFTGWTIAQTHCLSQRYLCAFDGNFPTPPIPVALQTAGNAGVSVLTERFLIGQSGLSSREAYWRCQGLSVTFFSFISWSWQLKPRLLFQRICKDGLRVISLDTRDAYGPFVHLEFCTSTGYMYLLFIYVFF